MHQTLQFPYKLKSIRLFAAFIVGGLIATGHLWMATLPNLDLHPRIGPSILSSPWSNLIALAIGFGIGYFSFLAGLRAITGPRGLDRVQLEEHGLRAPVRPMSGREVFVPYDQITKLKPMISHGNKLLKITYEGGRIYLTRAAFRSYVDFERCHQEIAERAGIPYR